MKCARSERRTVDRRRTRQLSQLVAYALLLASCENPLGPSTTTVGDVQVQPTMLSVPVGASGSLSASVRDTDGQPLSGRRVFWSSQNPSVATVSQTGTVTGVTPGVVAIAASSGGKSGLSTITVTSRPVSSVRVTPATNQVTVGRTATLTAEALDAGGVGVPGKTFLWSSTNDAVATVSSTGVVTALAPGNATISATVDGITGSATVTAVPVPIAAITVSPSEGTVTVGANLQLRATPVDAAGNTLAGRTITWTSSANAVATVSSSGLVVGLSAGTTTITATSEGKSGTASIMVTLVPIADITIAPSTATIGAGTILQLAATLRDAKGNVLGGRTVSWSSDQPTIASVSESGVVTGLTPGAARITAAADGKAATALITVTPVPIVSIDVTPASPSLTVGGTVQLTATARDAQGNALPGRVMTWISGAPSVATVSQTGQVSGVGIGTAIIFAASEGVSGSTQVNVSTVAVGQVRVTPSSSNLQLGTFVQLSAEVLDGSGSPLTGRTVLWSSSDQSVAAVSGTGRVQSVSPGTVTITATADGVAGTATVTVVNIPVAAVVVAPKSLTLVIQQTSQLSATTFDANNNVLTGRTVAWATGDQSIVSVSANGMITALAAGTTTVSATAEGLTDACTVTVTSVPAASVTVTPGSGTINAGATLPLTVTVKDASNNPLVGRAVTMTTSNPAIATVSPSSATTNGAGQASVTVTGVGNGAATITASSGSAQGFSTITVNVVPIATITVTPSPASVAETQTAQLTATAKDALGNVLTGRTLVWSSNNNAQVSVDQTGLITAVAGSGGQAATITAADATNTSTNGTTSVSVTYLPVATISVPSQASVTVGGQTQLTATLLSSGGATLSSTGRTITWGPSSDPAKATVNSTTGVVTGVATGSATIPVSASSPGQGSPATASVVVNVSNVPVASVTVTPGPTGTVHVGSPYQRTFTAVTKDALGNVLTGRTVVWSTSDATKAAVDPISGVVSGVATGTATITATSEGVQGTSSVTVDLVAVSTVAMTPGVATLIPPQTQQFTATPKDSAANTISGTALGGRATTWSSSDIAFATVSGSGLVTAVGTAASTSPITITATVAGPNGNAGTASVTVLAPVANVTIAAFSPDSVIAPGTVGGTATVTDAASNPLSGRSVTFASSSGRATVTPSGTSNASGQVSFTVTGVAGAGGPASVNITATSESKTSPAAAVRSLNPVATVTVTAPTDSIIGTGTIPTTATLKDAFNTTLSGRPVAFSSSNNAIATVDPSTGVVTAVAPGSVTITATAEGQPGTFVVRVLAPVATITVTAPVDSLSASGSLQATATLRDASNNVLTGRPVSWVSSNTGQATVNASGLITGVAAGTPTITASAEGQNGALPVRVLTSVAAIAVAAVPDSVIGTGGTMASSATATDAGTNPVQGRQLNIVSLSPAVAAVSAASGVTDIAGLVSFNATAVSVGSAVIQVTSAFDGTVGTKTVRVLAPVNTVSITTPGDSIIGTANLQATATLLDASSNVLTGRPVSWSSSNNAVATVNPSSGLVTGVAPGTATITGTAEGKAGNVTIRVLPPVASVVVTAPGDSVIGSKSLPATATLYDAGSNVIPGRPVTWSSTASGVASVNPATGVITGVTPGLAKIIATAEGKADTLDVRVLAPVASVTVTAPDSSVDVNGTAQATAVLKDGSGNVLTGRPITWSSSNSGIASVDLTGLITSVAPGQAAITATAETINGSIPVFRSQGPVNTVAVTPGTVTVGIGSNGTLTVTVTDAAVSPNPLAGIACTMTSADTNLVTVSAANATTNVSGQFTFQVNGIAAGSGITITVTCGTVVGTSSVTVQ